LEAVGVLGGEIPIELTLVGEGPRRTQVLASLPPQSAAFKVNLLGRLNTEQLRRQIELSDVVLGIFGASTKAGGVIANKVWQGLAAGRTVLTRRSDALNEIAEIVGPALWQVPEGDPRAIASALREIWRSRVNQPGSPAQELERYVEEQFLEFADVLRDAVLKKNGVL